MNLNETMQLLDKLREVGVRRFKSTEIEVDFTGDLPIAVRVPIEAASAIKTAFNTPEAQPFNAENTQKVQELMDLLQLKDEELANKIFPEGA